MRDIPKEARDPAYRIGVAAGLLDVSVDTVRRWADSGRLRTQRTEGGQRLVDGTDLARLATELAAERDSGDRDRGERPAASARNRLDGIVTKVTTDTVMAQVEIQVGRHRLVSLMTREAADELGLVPGVLAVAIVKSTNVVVEVVEAP
jgi:molybdopterin-binding protein